MALMSLQNFVVLYDIIMPSFQSSEYFLRLTTAAQVGRTKLCQNIFGQNVTFKKACMSLSIAFLSLFSIYENHHCCSYVYNRSATFHFVRTHNHTCTSQSYETYIHHTVINLYLFKNMEEVWNYVISDANWWTSFHL